MKTMSKLLSATAIALAAVTPASHAAEGSAGLEVGVLTCTVVPGSRVNLLIHVTADVTCTYENKGQTEKYNGETGIALGLDLSFKENEKFAFTVIAASSDVKPGAHALAGKYVGGEASATAGVGITAAALIGGGSKNISLQPIALGTQTGLGASGGIGFLYIEAAK